MKRLLILGGTGDAAKLAAQAALLQGVEVITSLAGRTRRPVTPSGRVRIGGFGGDAGLVDYMREQRIDLLIDATHPFAAQISFHAAQRPRPVAYRICSSCVLRGNLSRRSLDCRREYCRRRPILSSVAQRVFLTIGRQDLAAFAPLKDLWFLMRMIDPPPLIPGSAGNASTGTWPLYIGR